MEPLVIWASSCVAAAYAAKKLRDRLILSRAKHPSLRGHAKIEKFLSRFMPFFEYDETEFFAADGAPQPIADRRRAAFENLARLFRERSPKTIAAGELLESGISDVAFTNAYRVPFQFRNLVRKKLRVAGLIEESSGVRIRDLDGNWSYDLLGAYGMNVFGLDFYKACIDHAVARVRALGPALGLYHPLIGDNVARLQEISRKDEVSFHMSGTEAVMQAVRLARYHTRKTHLVRFCGAYHGWWDGVQPGVGNPRAVDDVYTLADMSEKSLRVLENRRDIACLLINPLQAMHPNSGAPSDSTLVASDRSAHYDRETYTAWLRRLRDVCTRRGIVLIFDEVFLGFRLAFGGAQEYFGVEADIVTYGKTIGGGLPIGVVCGRRDLMKRFRDDRPTDICFARGTFNSHPYVMAAMNEFLHRLDDPAMRAKYVGIDDLWDSRASQLNRRLEEKSSPIRVAGMTAIWTILYTAPCRYNWMFQYYLRAHGLSVSWVGTGRLIFSYDYTDDDYREVEDRFVAAAEAMAADGWLTGGRDATDKEIKRDLFRRMLAARFVGRPRAADAATRRPESAGGLNEAPTGISRAARIG